MISFNLIQSYEELISIYPEEAIYYRLLGHCDLDKHFCSVIPERIEEKGHIESTPSMRLSYYNGHIRWKDFGYLGKSGNVIQLAMLLFNKPNAYFEVLQDVFELMQGSIVYTPPINIRRHAIVQQIKYKPILQSFQVDYYKLFGISKETLKFYNTVYATEFLYENNLWHKSNPIDFMNLYLFNPAENVWHINRPYADIEKGQINPNNKHRPHNMKDILMGYKQLPKNADCMGITKSYKDVMLNYECGIPSICLYGEHMIIPEYIISLLKSRCKKLIYFGDNDSTGLKVQQIYKERYHLDVWSPPKEKDQTDFVKSHNGDKSELIKLFNQLKVNL